MKFDIITIFPKAFSYLNESILKRAQKKGLVEIKIHNLRDFTADRHRKVDDKSYGGGPGMVMKIEPIIKTIQSVKSQNRKLKAKSLAILLTPAGKQFDNKIAADLAKNYKNLILICGHYEGIDERVKKVIYDSGIKIQELSIGPCVLTGGELPAMILIDAVSRHVPGVLGKKESLEENRLGIGVPVYTRPEVFVRPSSGRGKKKKEYRVPGVLLSGNHLGINQWRAKHRKG
ncbi:tRNA (guanosine(37)-N1)-methyltransferase TrmD [Candidatus Jorgensenbacteria bacterium RIFCSPLOWO2_12_FULL_42_11]|uniref:tRNA (guanine-N(1)-)-methyltransferase n=1 Tax=Candidatus Jorgensenbacteria bacterium RIFCSPLOWO2_12_FULL_42_11 TaxID=1798473 RepID=A0A1F6C3H3_9BACT|nr:MAG: tRNA (guanosine(37)-N1)-methyltransferase TrmD [Candidatus Jorgensenbacteria bacterium RIFCSPLOWO2_12_FULL_42_11]